MPSEQMQQRASAWSAMQRGQVGPTQEEGTVDWREVNIGSTHPLYNHDSTAVHVCGLYPHSAYLDLVRVIRR